MVLGHRQASAGVLFILVLVFGVLRPVLNNITGGGKKQLALAGGDVELGGMGGLDGERPTTASASAARKASCCQARAKAMTLS